jgi:protein-tyrosine phosphatase
MSITSWFLPPLDYAKVTPQIAVGAAFPRQHIPQLRARGFTAVVDCREEARDDVQRLADGDIRFLHLPMRDHHAPSIELLAHGVEWIADHLARVDRAQVLVHCQEGIGRSPLLVACVLVGQGYSGSRALDLVRTSRPRVALTARQLQILLRFESAWLAATLRQPDPPNSRLPHGPSITGENNAA